MAKLESAAKKEVDIARSQGQASAFSLKTTSQFDIGAKRVVKLIAYVCIHHMTKEGALAYTIAAEAATIGSRCPLQQIHCTCINST